MGEGENPPGDGGDVGEGSGSGAWSPGRGVEEGGEVAPGESDLVVGGEGPLGAFIPSEVDVGAEGEQRGAGRVVGPRTLARSVLLLVVVVGRVRVRVRGTLPRLAGGHPLFLLFLGGGGGGGGGGR